VAGHRPRPAVYALEPHSLGDILSDVKTVGDATGRQGPARALIAALRARIDAVSLRSARALAGQEPRRIVCLASADPPVAAGWWLAELIGLAGGLDVLDGVGRPPRAVTPAEIEAARPDLVVDLTPDPSPARRGGIRGAISPLRAGEAVGIRGRRRSRCSRRAAAPGRVMGRGGEVYPGPGAVDLLEEMVALILPAEAGAPGDAGR